MKYGKTEEKKRIARYSLILETENGNYYYDFDLSTFVEMDEKSIPSKATIDKIDFLTANYDSKEQFIDCYDIKNPKILKITYQFNGEKRLAPVFNNPEWAELAKTFNGEKVDFRTYNNLYIIETVYNQIMKLDSNDDSLFANYLRFKCSLSPKTEDLIKAMVAHERATRNRYRYLMGVKDFQTEAAVSEIYNVDKDAYKSDFRKRMSKYRELRTVYLNYCKLYKNGNAKTQVIGKKQEEKPKKLVKEVQYKQLSMFD